MLKYYVRTTGERVLDESYNQIKYELLIDKEHKGKISAAPGISFQTLYAPTLIYEGIVTKQ